MLTPSYKKKLSIFTMAKDTEEKVSQEPKID